MPESVGKKILCRWQEHPEPVSIRFGGPVTPLRVETEASRSQVVGYGT